MTASRLKAAVSTNIAQPLQSLIKVAILRVFVSNLTLQHGTVNTKSKHAESTRELHKLSTSIFQYLKVD